MNRLAKAQDDARVSIACKACLLDSYLVCANSKLLGAEKALVVGCYRPRLAGRSIPQRHSAAEYRSTAAVANGTLKGSCNSRNLRDRAKSAKQDGKPHGNRDGKISR